MSNFNHEPTQSRQGLPSDPGDTSRSRETPDGAPQLTRINAASRVGWMLGKYQLLSVLGRGGMGDVFRAHDTVLERDVALKVLPEPLAIDVSVVTRFLAEAKAAARLSNPHTVAVYDVGDDGGVYYLAMELAAGGSVQQQLDNRGPLEPEEATRICTQVCRGLAAAHAQGLTHRDIKPHNLLMTSDGAVKVADFGLAKHGTMEDAALTRDGQVVGTPYYMSPEQCQSRPADARSDIYSLGATYFTLLTGEHPFPDSTTAVEVMYAHVHTPPLDPADINPQVPAACARIVRRAMAKHPEDRYQTAEDMLADLESASAASGWTVKLPSVPDSERGDVSWFDAAPTKSRDWPRLAAGLECCCSPLPRPGWLPLGFTVSKRRRLRLRIAACEILGVANAQQAK